MQPIRVKTVQESDLRMLGDLARNIQRVLPVTQADIDAAAALGKGWVVWKVFEVSDPLDNLRGGTQLIIRQNSIQPGQNVRRVIFVAGPGGQTVVIRGTDYIVLPDAIANSLSYVKAFGGTEQRNLPDGYTALEYIESSGTQYIDIDVSGDATFIGTAQSTTDSPTASQVLIANSGASAGHWFGVQSPGAGSSFTKRWGLGATATASSTIDGTTKVDFEITFTQSSQYGTVNDQVLNRESSTSAHTNWVIFAGTTTPLYGFVGKVWGLKVVQNDVLVRNLIPAKNSSNVIGMYDIVSRQFFTNAGTDDFVAGPDVIPTPDAPMDIVTNNGVLKYSKNLLDMSAENIVLGKYINNTGAVIDDLRNFYNNKYIPVVANGIYTWSISSSISYFSVMEYDSGYVFKKRTLFSNAGTSGSITLGSDTAFVLIGANMDSASATLDKIAAVDWQFEKGSSATAYTPYGIYTDGVVETINVHTRNLFDENLFLNADNWAVSDGVYTGTPAVLLALYGVSTSGFPISFKPATRYTIKYTVSQGSGVVGSRFRVYYTDNTYTDGTPPGSGVGGTYTIRTTSGKTVAKLTFVYTQGTSDISFSNVMLEEGTTASDYVPYFNGGTATTEMLLKVGNRQDVQSVLDGVVTRNVGIKVLDGTEVWSKSGSRSGLFYSREAFPGATSGMVLCTHLLWSAALVKGCIYNSVGELNFWTDFDNFTLNDWQQWLADQYTAGTPVIVIYPLATPTTESVAGQTLQVTDGDNVLEITQASLTGLELEAEYQKMA